MYSLEQLKIFITVCEKGSFSAAARALNRAQSGVSQAIANLEIAINQELFSRSKKTPTLTANGRVLLPIAQSILHQQLYFEQKIEALSQAHEHELLIAVDESLMSTDFVAIIAPLAEQFALTHFELMTASTFDIETLVREGKVHLGVVYADGELKVDMDFFLLGQAKFLTIAAPSHPLASLSLIHELDLKQHRQCVHRSAEQKELWFSYALSPKLWYANTHQLLLELVHQGIGWGNVPELLLLKSENIGKVKALTVNHEKAGWLTNVGCFVSRRHKNGIVINALVDRLQEYKFAENRWVSIHADEKA